jgi:hypothetical protein
MAGTESIKYKFWFGWLKGRDHLGEIKVNGWIMLKLF